MAAATEGKGGEKAPNCALCALPKDTPPPANSGTAAQWRCTSCRSGTERQWTNPPPASRSRSSGDPHRAHAAQPLGAVERIRARGRTRVGAVAVAPFTNLGAADRHAARGALAADDGARFGRRARPAALPGATVASKVQALMGMHTGTGTLSHAARRSMETG